MYRSHTWFPLILHSEVSWSWLQVEACRNQQIYSLHLPKADSLLEWLRRSFWFLPPTLHVPVSLCYTTAAGCPSTCPHTRCGARQIWLEWLSGRSCLVWKSSPQVVGHFCRCSSYFPTGNCGNYRQKSLSVSLLRSMGSV